MTNLSYAAAIEQAEFYTRTSSIEQGMPTYYKAMKDLITSLKSCIKERDQIQAAHDGLLDKYTSKKIGAKEAANV